jgi:hypothetical protein
MLGKSSRLVLMWNNVHLLKYVWTVAASSEAKKHLGVRSADRKVILEWNLKDVVDDGAGLIYEYVT